MLCFAVHLRSKKHAAHEPPAFVQTNSQQNWYQTTVSERYILRPAYCIIILAYPT